MLFGVQAEPFYRGRDLRPLLFDKSLSLVFQQLLARPFGHEHTATAFLLDQSFVDELLVAFQYGQRIETILRGNVSDGRQCIAVAQDVLENHRDHPVTQLAIDRLVFVPLGIH